LEAFSLQANQMEEDEGEDEEMGVAETYADYWPAKCKKFFNKLYNLCNLVNRSLNLVRKILFIQSPLHYYKLLILSVTASKRPFKKRENSY
jgi:hypothetical protein